MPSFRIPKRTKIPPTQSQIVTGNGGSVTSSPKKFPKTSYKQLLPLVVLVASIGTYMVFFSKAAVVCDYSAIDKATFATAVSNAAPGKTICLATGDYGTFLGTNKASPGITITASSGASVKMFIDFRASSGSSIGGMTIDGLDNITGGEITGNVHDITVKNSTFTNELNFWQAAGVENNACSGCQAMKDTNIVLDHNVFNMSSSPSAPPTYEGRVTFVGSAPEYSDITIKNSIFEDSCSDGVHFAGGGNGVIIGPGNEFRNIKQQSPPCPAVKPPPRRPNPDGGYQQPRSRYHGQLLP